MGRLGRILAATAALAYVALLSARASATQITVPLTIDYITLREALKSQIYNAPGGRANLWRGTNACEFLYAENPRFGRTGVAVSLETEATLGLGVPVGGTCINPISWKGIIEVDAIPYLTPNLMLMFRVSNINLYDLQHQKTLIVGRGFDLIKGNFIPRFETFNFDLRAPIDEFRTLAEEAAPPDQVEPFKQALASVRGVPPIVATADGVRLMLALNAPVTAPMQPQAVPSGPLTPAEVAAWDQRLDQWDAFIVFAIKQLGSAIPDKRVRASLLNLLLDGRYRLVEAMNQPPPPGGPDAVRLLFLDEWGQLRDIVRTAAANGQLGDRALEFLSFISAGDALMSFDEASPALGVRISAADLRRLARIMAPQVSADPLQFNYNEDPELQRMLGIVPPPETPDSVSQSDLTSGTPTASPAAAPSSSPPAAVSTPGPPAAASPPLPLSVKPARPSGRTTQPPAGEGSSSAASFIRTTLRLFSAGAALAETPPANESLTRIGLELRRAVVNEHNVDQYKRALSELLDDAANSEITGEDPDPALRPTYRLLVRAVAWQESCWRQFVILHDRIWFLESSTHDIGLMQVNKIVWRGFYSIPHLEWDIAYNAGAGSQILARLMMRAAERLQRDTDPVALARSTYAGYNGGPAEMNRWRRKDEPSDVRMVDEAFWQKYRALAEGQSIDILSCAAQWGKEPGH
jgi:Transglycosylase SLT domain